MTRFKTIIAGVATVGLLAGAAISAGHSDPVKERKDIMKSFGANSGILGKMASGDVAYDSVKAGEAAAAIAAVLSNDNSHLWPEGSEQGMAADSRAKIEIWQDMAGFGAEWMKFGEAAANLATAASVDLASLQGAIGPLGASCGSCHKAYRGPKN